MFKLIFKTAPYIILRIVIYIFAALIQAWVMYAIYFTGLSLTSWHPLLNVVIRPALVIIGIGVGVLLNTLVTKPIIYTFSLGHVVCATVATLGLPYKGSLFAYSFKQTWENFFQLTVNSVVTKSTLGLLITLKESIFQNDIKTLFNEPKKTPLKKVIDWTLREIRSLLDMLDELIVSYTWLATWMYIEFDCGGERPGVRKLAAKQAWFMLEGVYFFIRVFPKLLLSNVGYEILFFFIRSGLMILSGFLIYWLLGNTFLTVLLIFLFHTLIRDIVQNSLIYSFRVCSVIHSYYSNLGELDSESAVTPDDVKGVVAKLPGLIPLAKKTKLDEFKDLEDTNDSSLASGLVDVSAVTEVVQKEINNLAKCFMVDERDILKIKGELEIDAQPEVSQGQQDGGVEQVKQPEISGEIEHTEPTDADPPTPTVKNIIKSTTESANPVSEFDDLFLKGDDI